MEVINELEIRAWLDTKPSPHEQVRDIAKKLMEPSLTWEQKRPLFHLLYNTGRERTLVECLRRALEEKQRVPFDLIVQLLSKNETPPHRSLLDSLMKGLKKQKAFADILTANGLDSYEERLPRIRNELLEQKANAQKELKENLKEKFEFLKNQRMSEHAGKVLKQMIELYPDEKEFSDLKRDHDEQWAREVLSSHVATLQAQGLERTVTQPSAIDEQMLQCFLLEGEAAAVEKRAFAMDLGIAFWFMEDHARALEILAWAPVNLSSEWMRVEVLVAGRRFVEALDVLNYLEVKYIEDPETTFSVSYMRAQCLHSLGQQTAALEIMQSIVRVRTNYRSAHALIMEWSNGVAWE